MTVRARLDGQSTKFSLPSKVEEDLRDLYKSLQGKVYDQGSVALAGEVGHLLLSPIESLIMKADKIHFVVDSDLIALPLDVLPFGGSYLFLQKPIEFSLSGRTGSALTLSGEWSVLAIRDRTADPQDGVSYPLGLVGARRFHGLEEESVVRLGDYSRADVLLVSAHGNVGHSPNDFLMVGKQRVMADNLARVSPKLVYLDSCRLGISLEFIQAFARAGTLYYLAPIISNEAGNSSTRTIHIFFDELNRGETPSEALYWTRRTLFEEFEDDSLGRRLWRSFPFRAYSLN